MLDVYEGYCFGRLLLLQNSQLCGLRWKIKLILGQAKIRCWEHVDKMPKFGLWSRSGVGSGSGLESRLVQKSLFSTPSCFTSLFPFISIPQSCSSYPSVNNHSKVFSRSNYSEVICNSSEDHWGRLSAGLLPAWEGGVGRAWRKPWSEVLGG